MRLRGMWVKHTVVLDCRMYGMSGVGRYIENLIDEIVKSNTKNYNFVLVGYKGNVDKYKNSQNILDVLSTNLKPFSLSELLFGMFFFRKLAKKYSLVHFTHINFPLIVPKNAIITFHDLIPLIFPQYFSKPKLIVYKLLLALNKNRFRRFIAVSQSTKNDLVRTLNIHESKIDVIYEKTTLFKNYSVVNEHCKLNELPDKYLLYVGNRKRHKNLEFMIKVTDKIFDHFPDFKFIITGSRFENPDFVDDLLTKVRNKNNFIQIIHPSDEELICLYKKAYALLFISKYEGFGIPVIEASFFGIPSIVSNVSSLPEITRDSAILVNPEDEKDAFDKIYKLISDKTLRDELSKKAKENYEWFKNYPEIELLLETYEKALENMRKTGEKTW